MTLIRAQRVQRRFIVSPNTPPPPTDAAAGEGHEVPADAALLRAVAEDYAIGLVCTEDRPPLPCADCVSTAARLRALAVVCEKLDRLATGDWPYMAALADAQRYNGDGWQFFTSNHMRIVDRMTEVLTELRSGSLNDVQGVR